MNIAANQGLSGMNVKILLALAMYIAAMVPRSYGADVGWPRSTGGFILSSPAIVDLDTDGRKEIIITSLDDKLYAWKYTGEPFTYQGHSFPVRLGFGDGTIGSVSVGDVDADGVKEIIVGGDGTSTNNPKIFMLDLNDNFTTSVTTLGSETTSSFKSTIALVNCIKYYSGAAHDGEDLVMRNGDGKIYIYALTGTFPSRTWTAMANWSTVSSDSERDRYGNMPITPSPAVVSLGTSATLVMTASTDGRIHLHKFRSTPSENIYVEYADAAPYDLNGTEANEWILSSPVVQDIDQDGYLEIAIGANDNRIHVLEINSITYAITEEWCRATDGWIVGSPAIADVNGDSRNDIVVGSSDHKVYAYKDDGTTVTGWPQYTQGEISTSPVIAELDGQPGLEVIVTCFDRQAYILHADGTLLDNWPKKLNSPFFASPAVADLNGDGRQEIVFTTYKGGVSVWEMARKSLNTTLGWHQFRGNERRQGCSGE